MRGGEEKRKREGKEEVRDCLAGVEGKEGWGVRELPEIGIVSPIPPDCPATAAKPDSTMYPAPWHERARLTRQGERSMIMRIRMVQLSKGVPDVR